MMRKARSSLRPTLSALVALCVCVPLALHAQQRNPYEADETAVDVGGTLFASRCADCHGADAKGVRGPDLTLLWGAGANDQRVFASIRGGKPGSIMPPSVAPDQELWAIVAYLRSISTVPPFPNGRGDAQRGSELFDSQCASCHRAREHGGTLGPDLSRIGQTRSREALVTAIREPDASVPLGYRAVTLRTNGGAKTEGVVKSEDAFSIQIMDAEQRLRGFRKADLADVVRQGVSPMPPFRSSDRKLDDLIAFLGTLRDADAGRAKSASP